MIQKELRFKLNDKINLWDTPGFVNFIHDLTEYVGTQRDIAKDVEVLRKIYKAEVKKIKEERSKFKQGKLGL